MEASQNSRKNIYIILGSLIVLFIILVILLKPQGSNNLTKVDQQLNQQNQPQAQEVNPTANCQDDIKTCPNGATVNRIPPKCEFAPCPDETTNLPTISISEAGFEPKELRIKTGDEVIFKNTGIQDHWPASDPHPTHTILPEFDAKKPIKSGQTFQFKFNKAGIWPCHDHLNPSLRCVIIVE